MNILEVIKIICHLGYSILDVNDLNHNLKDANSYPIVDQDENERIYKVPQMINRSLGKTFFENFKNLNSIVIFHAEFKFKLSFFTGSIVYEK